MDTKLKSSKKVSFLVAGILTALAVLVYMACYPLFKKQIHEYLSSRLINEQLLGQIYQSNLVLYKDIYERAKGENISFAELYMTMEEEKLSEEADDYPISMEDIGSKELAEALSSTLNSLMDEWQDNILDGLVKGMDYYVIDHETGEVLKNTGRNIEKLYDSTMEEEENPYVYFIKLSYDNAGNLSHISVYDSNPDELLKNAQSIMARKLLRKSLNEHSGYFSNMGEESYICDRNGQVTKLKLQIDESPKNVTFIYALTEKQREIIFSQDGGYNFVAGYSWSQKMAYYEAGAGNVYVIILLLLAAAALLATRFKNYCLHHLSGFHMHLEVAATVIIILMYLAELAVTLVCATNNGIFSEFYRNYTEFLPDAAYPVVTTLINILVLAALFGGWYYAITALGEVFDLGIIGFLKERSLIVHFCLWIVDGCRRKKNRWKEELLHVDLSTDAGHTLRKFIFINFCILAVITSLWAFGWAVLVFYSLLLYIYSKKYISKIQKQYEKALAATVSIAEGNLNTVLNEDFGVFEAYRSELNKIQDGFRKAVDEEVKSQRMKTELITNVSHDLKTPLTAITTYIELLEDENITQEQRKEYLAVLKKKSARLKFLIEDLFEVSKANSGNVALNLTELNICNLIRQVYLEYEDEVEEANLIFRFALPEGKVILQLDSQKTYRVFENLYNNIIKYAMPHTRVYVNAVRTDKGIRVELKNMSAAELNIPPQELTERFVRGDSSRNTEGSGLGLAIARSFVEIQGGKLTVEIDGDLFKVMIEF